MSRAALVLVGLAAALLAAAPAHATTYCVHLPDDPCAAGSVDKGANVQGAIDSAQATTGNTVHLGTGTFAPATRSQISGANPIVFEGSGADKTTLTTTDTVGGYVLEVTTPETRVTDLQIDGGSTHAQLDLFDHASAERVRGTGGVSYGFVVQNGSVSDSTIECSGVGQQGLVLFTSAPSETVNVEDVQVNCTYGVSSNAAQVHITRSVVVGSAFGLRFYGGTMDVRHSIIRSTGVDSDAVRVSTQSSPVSTLVLSDCTIDGYGATGTTTGISVEAVESGTTATATVTNCVIADVTRSFHRTVSGGGTAADITLTYSDFAKRPEGGPPGTVQQNHPSNFNLPPGFADVAAGDFRPLFGSPLLDAGTGTPQAFDVGLQPRGIDADGDGNAVRDIGAWEYQRQAPAAVLAGPDAGTVGETLGFDAGASSDADPGDALTFTWDFGDGGTATGAQASHAFPAAGAYVVKVTVRDPSGLQASATRTVTVAAPPSPSPSPTPTPTPVPLVAAPLTPAPDTTKPSLSKVSVKYRSKHKAELRLTLSERADVTYTLERRNSKKRYVRVKRSTRHGLGPGAEKISLGTLKKGTRYRITLYAKDAAGNRSSSKTVSARGR